jgi:hypothetical protein
LNKQLAITGFVGINNAEMVNVGRAERAARINGEGRND